MAEKKPTAKPVKPLGPLTPVKAFEHDRELLVSRFSPCGKYVMAVGYDRVVHRWDVESGAKATFGNHDGWLQAFSFHPDGKRMFTLDSWGRVSAWNYADEKPQPLWAKTDTHKGWAKNLAVSNDGNLLATCGADCAVRVWSTADGAPKGEFKGHEEDVFSIAFHPDNKSLVSGDLRGVIKQWDLASGKATRELDAKTLYLNADEINEVGGVRFLAFGPQGKTLAAGGGQPLTSGFVTAKPAVILFDWATGKQSQLLQLGDAKPDDGFAMDAIFHPAGFLAVVCSGAPGQGALWCWRPGEKSPFHLNNKDFLHCRTVSLHKDGVRMLIAHVGRSPGGNGRQLNAKGEYEGNKAFVKVFETKFEGVAVPTDGPSRTVGA